MTTKNLTKYLTQPLTLKAGGITLVAPVPSVEFGKKLALLVESSVLILRGEAPDKSDIPEFDNIEDVEDLARLIFTADSVDNAIKAGISLPDLTQLTQYAIVFWTLGEDAATAWLESEADPKARGHRKP